MVNPDKDVFQCEYVKLLSKDLKQSKKKNDSNVWLYDIVININNTIIKKTLEFLIVQIQGIIEEKFGDDIMVIKDSTGKFKITNCEKALRSKATLSEGTYCSVAGVLVREKGLPEISAIKLIPLGDNEEDRKFMFEYWPVEVEDYRLFVAEAISPELKFEDT